NRGRPLRLQGAWKEGAPPAVRGRVVLHEGRGRSSKAARSTRGRLPPRSPLGLSFEDIKTMNRSHLMLTLLAASAAAMLGVGCGPDYPSCDTDGDCHDGEFCVNGQCQQCREDADCGAGQACNGGRCDDIPGYCSANTDCPAGQTCVNNACVAPEGYCATDADCPEGRECVDNVCVESAESANSCSLSTVFFPF